MYDIEMEEHPSRKIDSKITTKHVTTPITKLKKIKRFDSIIHIEKHDIEYWFITKTIIFGLINNMGLEKAGFSGSLLASKVIGHIGAKIPENSWSGVLSEINK